MNKIACEKDIDVFIESAGIFADAGKSASENAIRAMQKYNIDLTNHKSQPITEDLIKESDIILTMTEAHKRILEPLAGEKVFTVSEYAGETKDISDPYGGNLEKYEETAREIYDKILDIAEKIADK